MPDRIQLRRTEGWKMPPNTVSVARGPGRIWGNPFTVADAVAVANCPPIDAQQYVVDCFGNWLRGDRNDWLGAESDAAADLILANLSDLRGKNLACWCKILVNGEYCQCHADVLLSLANDIPLEDVIHENIRRAKGEAL